MQRSIAEVIGNVIFHSPSGNPSALTLLKRDEYLAPATSQPERFAMKIIPMLLAALLATGAATAQAQDGSERSWQYNAEPRRAERTARKAPAEATTGSASAEDRPQQMRRAQERQRLSSHSPSNTLVLLGCSFGQVLRRQSWRFYPPSRLAEEGGMVASDQPPSPSRLTPAMPAAAGCGARRAGAGLAWSLEVEIQFGEASALRRGRGPRRDRR